jgi:uncharacterized hydantoinase/oxoprolinase family protein
VYTGSGGYLVRVNATPNGLEFVDGTTLFAAASHTHLLAAGATDVTSTAAEVNLLDLAGLTAGWVLSADTATTASWKQLLFSDLGSTPTTLSGYGILDTKANFDTALSDGNFMYIGDAPTAHTHLLAAGATDVTATAAEVNLLDLSGLTVGWVLSADSATTASWNSLWSGYTRYCGDIGC